MTGTDNSIRSARMPVGAPNPMPRMTWPTDDVLAARARAEFADQLRSKGYNEAQIDEAIKGRVEIEKAKHEKLKAAHKDFEAFFVGMLFTEMKKSVKKNGMFDGGQGEEMFEKRLTEEQSKILVSRGDGFGIAKMMDQAYLRSLGTLRDSTTGEWRVPGDDIQQLAGTEGRLFDEPNVGRISAKDLQNAVGVDGQPIRVATTFTPPPRLTTLGEGLDGNVSAKLAQTSTLADASAAKSVDEVRDRANRASGLRAYGAK